jgi:hypothetical protein
MEGNTNVKEDALDNNQPDVAKAKSSVSDAAEPNEGRV